TGDDPLNATDPLGQDTIEEDGGGAGGAGEYFGYGGGASGGGGGGGSEWTDVDGRVWVNDDNGDIEYSSANPAVEQVESLAKQLAKETGGSFGTTKGGFSVKNIPDLPKGLQVRTQPVGTDGKPYFRVTVAGKSAYTAEGELSSSRALTHIRVGRDSLAQILKILARIGR